MIIAKKSNGKVWFYEDGVNQFEPHRRRGPSAVDLDGFLWYYCGQSWELLYNKSRW